MAGNSGQAGRSVASKITSILLTFTEGSEHTLTEIAQRAALPVSTAHRLTAELVSWRLLQRTAQGRYRAGLPLRMLGAHDAGRAGLEERASCVLEDLAAITCCGARLGVLRELEVAYIEKQPGPRPATGFHSGATLPAAPTALGRALLAFAPAGIVDMALRRGLRAYTPYTTTSPDRLRRALALTRMTRVAVTRWELAEGASGIATPVFGPGGTVVAALELSLPDVGPEVARLLPTLSIAARSLGRELAGGERRPAGAVAPAPAAPGAG